MFAAYVLTITDGQDTGTPVRAAWSGPDLEAEIRPHRRGISGTTLR